MSVQLFNFIVFVLCVCISYILYRLMMHIQKGSSVIIIVPILLLVVFGLYHLSNCIFCLQYLDDNKIYYTDLKSNSSSDDGVSTSRYDDLIVRYPELEECMLYDIVTFTQKSSLSFKDYLLSPFGTKNWFDITVTPNTGVLYVSGEDIELASQFTKGGTNDGIYGRKRWYIKYGDIYFQIMGVTYSDYNSLPVEIDESKSYAVIYAEDSTTKLTDLSGSYDSYYYSTLLESNVGGN